MKFITKAALGAGITCLTAGALMYEAFLDMDVHKLISENKLFEHHSDEEKNFEQENQIAKDATKWFDSLTLSDTEIYSPHLKREIYGLIIPSEKNNSKECNKWAFVVHGYTDNIKNMAHYAQKYFEMGYNVLMPHLVGHGPDKVRHTSMGYYDRYMLLDWIEYILTLYPDAEIILHGVSMGAATVMLATGEKLPKNVKAAVSDCGYTSCWEEYASQMKALYHLPAFPLLNCTNLVSKLSGNFDFKECSPLNAVIFSETPTLFIHGEEDTFVPYEMMERVYEACGSKRKDMLSVPDATHATSVYHHNDIYWNKVFEFINHKED